MDVSLIRAALEGMDISALPNDILIELPDSSNPKRIHFKSEAVNYYGMNSGLLVYTDPRISWTFKSVLDPDGHMYHEGTLYLDLWLDSEYVLQTDPEDLYYAVTGSVLDSDPIHMKFLSGNLVLTHDTVCNMLDDAVTPEYPSLKDC